MLLGLSYTNDKCLEAGKNMMLLKENWSFYCSVYSLHVHDFCNGLMPINMNFLVLMLQINICVNCHNKCLLFSTTN